MMLMQYATSGMTKGEDAHGHEGRQRKQRAQPRGRL